MTPDTPHSRHRKIGIVYDPACLDCQVERPQVATVMGPRVKTRRARRTRGWLRSHGKQGWE